MKISDTNLHTLGTTLPSGAHNQRAAAAAKFTFLVPVWGNAYVDTFLNKSLLSLLTQDNFPALGVASSSVLKIITRYEDAQRIENSALVAEARKYLRVEVILIEGLFDKDVYRTMSAAYRRGMADEIGTDGYFVFLTPDSYWLNGTVCTLMRYANSGFQAVMILGVRVSKEQFWRDLCARFPTPDALNRVGYSDLAALALRHLHPAARIHNVLCADFANEWPSHVYWMENGCISAHGFHLHPLLVKKPKRDQALSFEGTIDTDFLERLGYPVSSYYVITDGREVLGLDMADDGKFYTCKTSEPSLAAVTRWAGKYASKYHWWFFRHNVVIALPGASISPTVARHQEWFLRAIEKTRRRALFLRFFRHCACKTLAKARYVVAVLRLVGAKS